MNKKRKKNGGLSLLAVIIICIMISAVVVSGIFFIRSDLLAPQFLSPLFDRISFDFMQKEPNFNELVLRGSPEKILEAISTRPAVEHGADTILYWRGKAWYLIAWQRYEADRWREYAQNPDDWFDGEDVDSALYLLYRAAEFEDTWAQSVALIGSIYMDKGWFDRAQTAFRRVLREGPHRESHLNYGISLSRTGMHREAVAHLKRWPDYENDPDFTRNLFFLYMFNLHDYSEAARLGNRFLTIAPRGNFDIPLVIRELRDLHIRFPEYFDDTMIIIRDRPPEFPTRRR